jgi:hypothetical protein
MNYKIAIGTDPGKVQTKEMPWDVIADKLTSHQVALTKGGRYFVGGAFKAPERIEANLTCRSMLTLDIDEVDMNIEALEFALRMAIDSAFVAYSTFSHTPNAPKVRVIVPLSRDLSPNEYRAFSRAFGDSLGIKLDPCSFKPNQYMYLPSCSDERNAWAIRQDGEPLEVPTDLVADDDAPDGDLADLVNSQPLDISDDAVDAYLAAYDPNPLDYEAWFTVGAALHHQYQGEKTQGYARWLKWSERSKKHDPKQMPMKWRSFGKGARKLTFASVIHHVRQAQGDAKPGEAVIEGDVVEAAAFESLADDAASIQTIEQYDNFKARLQQMTLNVLPLDKRAMLAQEVYDAFGKAEGLTKTDIKRELKPTKRALAIKRKKPEWAEHWVYIEKTCEFYHSELHYAIKREAFDAKYGREVECELAEMQPSKLVLNEYQIETVVDLMFWPTAGLFFTERGRRMLNTYRNTGVVPADEIDEDGQSVIDLFLRHVALVIEDEAEQRLLIDFMAWVVQNPGTKINWVVLLQGAQGIGKTYFSKVMQYVIGDMARNVEPSALAGRFTSWAHGATLVIVEEIRVAGENRYETLDKLKPFITNDNIQIEEKGRDHRTVPNFTSYMMFTNYKDALPIGGDDRRYAPIFSRLQSKEQLFAELGGSTAADAYFTNLFQETERRPDALARFLLDHKIDPAFNPKGRAPHTRAHDMMTDLAISPEKAMILDAIEQYECAAINQDVVDVTWLNKLCEGEGMDMPKTRTFSAIMLDLGYEQVRGRRVKISKLNAYHYVWAKPHKLADAAEIVQRYHDNGGDDCPF